MSNAQESFEAAQAAIDELNEALGAAQVADEDIVAPKSLFEIWGLVLDADLRGLDKPVTGDYIVNNILNAWPRVEFHEGQIFVDYKVKFLKEYRLALASVVELHPDVLKHTGSEEVEKNRPAILELLLRWHTLNAAILGKWTCTDEHAYIKYAAATDVATHVTSGQGILGYLASFGFQLTEEERAELNAKLDEVARD